MVKRKVVEIKFAQFDLARILAGPTPAPAFGTPIEIAQVSILPQQADNVQTGLATDSVDEGQFSKIAIDRQIAAKRLTGLSLPNNYLGIVVG